MIGQAWKPDGKNDLKCEMAGVETTPLRNDTMNDKAGVETTPLRNDIMNDKAGVETTPLRKKKKEIRTQE